MSRPNALASRDGDTAHAQHAYQVATVEKTGAPDGTDSQEWYRYVLKSGRSTITGQRRGSRKDVQAYAAHCAEQLNQRAANGKSMWSPRGRKPANASGS